MLLDNPVWLGNQGISQLGSVLTQCCRGGGLPLCSAVRLCLTVKPFNVTGVHATVFLLVWKPPIVGSTGQIPLDRGSLDSVRGNLQAQLRSIHLQGFSALFERVF